MNIFLIKLMKLINYRYNLCLIFPKKTSNDNSYKLE